MTLVAFRLASCGSDKIIKIWGREGDCFKCTVEGYRS